MKKVVLIALVLFSTQSFAQKEHQSFEDNEIKYTFETTDGRFDGQYVSYYQNGQKKAEGSFENNYRTGLWTVWDSTGRIRMKRDYTDPFTFKRLIPKVPTDKVIQHLNVPQYSIEYNPDGYINYFWVKERMVVWAKRVWREILPVENPILFNDQNLNNVFYKNVINGNLIVYSDEDFRNVLTATEIDTSNYTIVGLKILEDCFFDNERMVSEFRIIGVCPVVYDIQSNETIELFWAYFPDVRKYLAQNHLTQTELPEEINTLDDLFFYRYFYGQIYKQENVYDRPISAYKQGKEIAVESLRISLSIIEAEHDIWISFSK